MVERQASSRAWLSGRLIVRMSVAALGLRLDWIADTDAAGPRYLRPDTEGQRFGCGQPTAVGLQRAQRVEIAETGCGVMRRDGATAHVPLRLHRRRADPNAAAEPRVLLVRGHTLDSEKHAEAP